MHARFLLHPSCPSLVLHPSRAGFPPSRSRVQGSGPRPYKGAGRSGPASVAGGQEEAGCLFVRGARRVPRWPQGLGHSRGSGSSGSLMTGFFLPLVLVWAQDIGLKMAFMKSVVQVTKAVENLRDTEDFQFAQKTTLTAILVVSPGSSALCTGGL